FYFSIFFFSSRRRHTRSKRDWSSDVCSSDLNRGRSVRRCRPLTVRPWRPCWRRSPHSRRETDMTDTGKQALAALIDSDRGVYTTGGFTPREGPGLDLIPPLDRALIGTGPPAAQGQLDEAVAAARATFNERSWADDGAHRAEVLRRLADLVVDNAEQIAYLDGIEAGKVFADSVAADVEDVAANLRFS